MPLRREVTAAIGGDFVDDAPAHGGFSAGYAGVVRTTRGHAFVKALPHGGHADSLGLYRQEGVVLEALPAPLTPAVRAVIDADEGFALVIEAVPGVHPGAPWQDAELRAIAHQLQKLAETPAPLMLPDAAGDMGVDLTRWQQISDDPHVRAGLPPGLRARISDLLDIEQHFSAAVSGAQVIHGDLRADNILIDAGEARLLDWPWAVRGAAWFDLPSLLPSVEASGGPRCEDAWKIFEELGAPSQREHLPLIAAIASYFWYSQAQPEPAELPGLRAFQRAQARPALRWLDTLL